jgi:hypothetical protein
VPPAVVYRAVDTCPECGNDAMRVRMRDGASVQECGLCGARLGDRRVLGSLADEDEAGRRGIAPELWPLVRAIDALPGLRTDEASAGDPGSSLLPFIAIDAVDARALVQLENLAKSLELGRSELRLDWALGCEFRRHLVFVLRPRPAGAAPTATAGAAAADLQVLGRQLERNVKLGWWRHPAPARSG